MPENERFINLRKEVYGHKVHLPFGYLHSEDYGQNFFDKKIFSIFFNHNTGIMDQLLHLMTINNRPANAMIARNGVSADFGVLVVSGKVVTIVDGVVFGRVVFTGSGVELVVGDWDERVIVSLDVTSGSPKRSNPYRAP